MKSEDPGMSLPPFMRGILIVRGYLRTKKTRVEDFKRLKVLRSAIEAIKEEYERALLREQPEIAKINNVALYSLVFDYDITTLKGMLLVQIDRWNRQYLCRQLAVILYEATDDILQLVGKDFRKMLSVLPDSEPLAVKLNHLVTGIVEFKTQNKDFLKEVRNLCGAHRDLNAYNQLVAIDELDTVEVLDAAKEFLIPVNQLISLYTDVMKSMIKGLKSP